MVLTNRWLPKNAVKVPELADIPKFSTDVHFEPYPSTVDIENKYDCNAQSLRVCDINDNTTLFGCKELTARCRHFEKDVKYFTNGNELVIPKNEKPNEGYALAITTLSEACNPYHGDLVLVAANRESTEYMLICSCKNPGFIGNEHLLGNCSTVFICDGKIDNIDQPLEKINCVCEPDRISKRRGDMKGAPVCEPITIKEANEKYENWTNLVKFDDRSTLPISQFNATIRGNLKVDNLTNPCAYSLLDYSEPIRTGQYSNFSKRCQFQDGGIPVKTGMLEEPQLAPYASFDAVLPSDRYDYFRFTDNTGGKRRRAVVHTGLRFHPTASQDRGLVLLTNASLGGGPDAQLSLPVKNEFLAPHCFGSWPSYSCRTTNGANDLIYGVPFARPRECPSEFLWGREYWNDAESLTRKSIKHFKYGIEIDQNELSRAKLNIYGVAFAHRDVDGGGDVPHTGLLRMIHNDDYKLHKNTIT